MPNDAHWLDPESAQVLAFVARRLRNERILMLFAARDQPEASVFSGITELAVHALGPDDAVELLLSAAGDILLDRQVAQDTAVRAEGNPLALIEVGHELAARRTPPPALLDEPLPVGYRLRRHYESQIRRVLEAVTATLAASQMTAQVTPAEVGGRILHALGENPPRTGAEQLLAGLATLLTSPVST